MPLRKLLVSSGVLVGLMAPSAASAAITQVFGSVTCTTQPSGATAGQRWCPNSGPATVASFDGTPIDVVGRLPRRHGRRQQLPRRRHLPRLGRHQDHALAARPRSAG